MTLELINGNCLELMKKISDKSIDLMICDLPYGETNCKWDIKIDMDEFWTEFKRIRKSPRVACIHFCSTKFGYQLIKSWEKGFKMDMVWKKRNKTGGLQSRHRPMRNHEMVYFFYDQAPKYNRDKYHKRIKSYPAKKENGKDEFGNDNKGVSVKECGFASNFDPPNPASVLEEKTIINEVDEKYNSSGYKKELVDGVKNFGTYGFEPPNPASVLEEKKDDKMDEFGWSIGKLPRENRGKEGFDPLLPTSIIEEDERINENNKSSVGWDIKYMDKPRVAHFDPLLPVSVVEEKKDIYGEKKKHRHERYLKNGCGDYEPVNPVSVLEEDEPVSMFESTKVFIGKRHHQTEKPQDILEFFIKYWTDEGETILDPTMGSGSTGVACKKLNRNFIGFELNEDIFKVAQGRIEKT